MQPSPACALNYRLNDLFPRRESGHNLLSDGLGLNVVDQVFYHFEVDVGLKQR
jgi:hypothetical protein